MGSVEMPSAVPSLSRGGDLQRIQTAYWVKTAFAN